MDSRDVAMVDGEWTVSTNDDVHVATHRGGTDDDLFDERCIRKLRPHRIAQQERSPRSHARAPRAARKWRAPSIAGHRVVCGCAHSGAAISDQDRYQEGLHLQLVAAVGDTPGDVFNRIEAIAHEPPISRNMVVAPVVNVW